MQSHKNAQNNNKTNLCSLINCLRLIANFAINHGNMKPCSRTWLAICPIVARREWRVKTKQASNNKSDAIVKPDIIECNAMQCRVFLYIRCVVLQSHAFYCIRSCVSSVDCSARCALLSHITMNARTCTAMGHATCRGKNSISQNKKIHVRENCRADIFASRAAQIETSKRALLVRNCARSSD